MNLRSVSVVPYHRAAESDFPALSRLIADAMGGSGGRNEPNRTQGGLSVNEQVRSFRHWVYVAIRALQNAISRVPLRVYDITDPANPVEVEDENDPLVNLLRYPNPWDTDIEFLSRIVGNLELTGNCCLLKVRDALGVAELWPIPSQWIRPIHKPGRPVDHYLMDAGQGSAVPIPAADIVQNQYPNPQDRFWGLGTLAAAVPAMRSYDSIAGSRDRCFTDEILQDIVFRTENNLDDQAFKRFRQQIAERYGGAQKRGLPLLLEGSTSVEHLGRPPAEMAFRESSLMLRDEILSVFQVPPLLAGIVDNANRSNAQEQNYVFQSVAVEPRLRLIEARWNRDPELVPPGRRVAFDSPVPADREKEIANLVKLSAAGILTPNEVRAAEGYPPAPWGDVPLQVLKAQQPAAVAPPPERHVVPARRDSARAAAQRSKLVMRANLVRRIEGDQEKLIGDAEKTLRRFFAQQMNRVLANVERLFGDIKEPRSVDRRVRVAVNRNGERLYPDGSACRFRSSHGRAVIGDAVVSPSCFCGDCEWQWAVERALDPADADRLDDWDRAARELWDRVRRHLEASLESGASMQLDQLLVGAAFDLQSPAAIAWMNAKRRAYWDGAVNDTTKDRLSEALGRVMADGPTPEKLAEAVRTVFEGETEGREKATGGRFASSNTIARTEVAGAYNGGAQLVREDLGVSKKEWMATFDSRTRSSHESADGQVRKNDERFLVGGAELLYPGDPSGPVSEIANCRCACAAVPDPDDELVPPDDGGAVVAAGN